MITGLEAMLGMTKLNKWSRHEMIGGLQGPLLSDLETVCKKYLKNYIG